MFFKLWVENSGPNVVNLHMPTPLWEDFSYLIIDLEIESGEPNRISYGQWIESNAKQRPNGMIVSIPVNFHSYNRVQTLILDLKHWADAAGVFAGAYRRMARKLEQAFEPVRKIKAILMRAPIDWRSRLAQAYNAGDSHQWLVYADYIEERGDTKTPNTIRGIFSQV